MKPYPILKMKNPTAWDMLDFVIKIVEENEDRLWMRYWVTMIDGKIEDESEDASLPAERRVPECGTVACIAGWVCLSQGITNGQAISSRKAFELMGIEYNEDVWWDLRTVFLHLDADAKEALTELREVMASHEIRLKQEITHV